MQIRYHTFDSKRSPGHWLHVSEVGHRNAETVLMVHGAAGNQSNFSPQMKALADQFRVVAVDLRGHGRSPWPVPKPSIHDFYQDLEEFLDWMPERFSLVAHSFGGYLSTRLAATHPQRVRHLALLNTAQSIPRGFSYKILELMTPGADFVKRPEAFIAANTEVCKHLLGEVLQNWDCTPYYQHLDMPRMTVLGALDPLIPLVLGQESAKALGGPVYVLPLGHHVCMHEAPSQVNGWLLDLLKQ
ncbi:alpha/beta fold hydrolase [bacterium]|nr:alpha/beta fold hydrolase [bacterium]